uniref:HTH cro/C1-type domain-containing protein n=1 Tax=Geobacillus stearothermophilus TaxID=1422 RepID=B5DC75_GEOSE|nr:hypothetical protein GS18_E4_03 [Geobacillus stearothermophilus]
MNLQKYVGEKIKEFRLKQGMSQEELAVSATDDKTDGQSL